MIITSCDNEFYRIDNISKTVLDWAKTQVRPEYRFYEPTDKYGGKGWHLHESILHQAASLASAGGEILHFNGDIDDSVRAKVQEAYDTAIRSRPAAKSAPQRSNKNAYATLYLLPNAPPTIVEAVWKQLAKEHHPDAGGDAERFKHFNDAYSTIKGKK